MPRPPITHTVRTHMPTRRCLLTAALASGFATGAAPPRMPSVVFLNPGSPNPAPTGPMARAAVDYMALAASQLGMHLEVQNASHDHLKMIDHAREVAARPRTAAPDYVIIVNDKMAGPALLEALEPSPARVFVIHSDMTDEQRSTLGNERERYVRWIGSAVPDNTRGVFRLAAVLHRELGERPISAIGITGPNSTPVSNERAQGLADYLAGVRGARLEQLVYSDWSEADGERKAQVLLARYPQTNLIWAANDEMALGALKAARARGFKAVVGGMGGFGRALHSLAEDGGLTATLAGHHLVGAWAMVMLYDHANGIDFAADGGLRRRLDNLHVVTRANLRDYEQAFSERERPIDFRRYSKVHNPKVTRYDFGLAALLSGSTPP